MEDMLALVYKSKPNPAALENTCAGMSENESRAVEVRVRAQRAFNGEEESQLLVSPEAEARDVEFAMGVLQPGHLERPNRNYGNRMHPEPARAEEEKLVETEKIYGVWMRPPPLE